LKTPLWPKSSRYPYGSTIPVALDRFIILCGRPPQRREDKSGKDNTSSLDSKITLQCYYSGYYHSDSGLSALNRRRSRNVSSWLGLRVKLSATTKQQAYAGTPGHFVDYLDTNEGKIFTRPTCQESFVFLTGYHHELTLKSAIRG
jgi:hypothetical protein